MERTPRNIVVCCDGTSNTFAKDLTSVAKLSYALVKDTDRQMVAYQPGVGTRAPGFNLPLDNFAARLIGLAFGYGIKDDIRDAYIYIMNHWRPGDRLFLFGFSRGAYTVRALAGLIHHYGILMPGNDMLVPYAINMFWKASGTRGPAFDDFLRLADRFKASLSFADCKPHFVGVFDTVSSVGWVGSPISLPATHRNPDIATFRHAVSIDEHRAFFRSNLFAEDSGGDVLQIWFPGDHCDVGGGYLEADSGMSKYPLKWMIDEARRAGLLLNEVCVGDILGAGGGHAPPSPLAPLHGRIPWYWWPAEFVLKKHWNARAKRSEYRANLFRRRTMPPAPKVFHIAWDIPGYIEDPKRHSGDWVKYIP